eukprot:TRINITY_DN51900_c0_g1_i1.p1 TRINITY_DN51900_c0_g1~~TRINITY_DN51900_c0_g1_i1.p1  ORF type:complete len:130 (+),score=1.40 TRINITY_DN51900_c0_g1_i1:3-392(+)
MVTRLTYRRKLSYNTKGNQVKVVRTPGNRQVYQHLKKKGSLKKCGDCKTRLHGMKCVRPFALARMPKRLKTVFRTYGGVRCHKCVRARIIRAFLVEEQRIVLRVLKAQGKKGKRRGRPDKEEKGPKKGE